MQPTEVQTLLQQVNTNNYKDLEAQLQQAVNYLLLHHFEKLVHILYSVDVDEKVLKTLLQENKEQDAAVLITHLLIERQLQKAALRQRFNNRSQADNEEKW